MTDQRRPLAEHEARHAVVALMAGYSVDAIELGDDGGLTSMTELDGPSALNRLMVFAAGCAGQKATHKDAVSVKEAVAELTGRPATEGDLAAVGDALGEFFETCIQAKRQVQAVADALAVKQYYGRTYGGNLTGSQVDAALQGIDLIPGDRWRWLRSAVATALTPKGQLGRARECLIQLHDHRDTGPAHREKAATAATHVKAVVQTFRDDRPVNDVNPLTPAKLPDLRRSVDADAPDPTTASRLATALQISQDLARDEMLHRVGRELASKTSDLLTSVHNTLIGDKPVDPNWSNVPQRSVGVIGVCGPPVAHIGVAGPPIPYAPTPDPFPVHRTSKAASISLGSADVPARERFQLIQSQLAQSPDASNADIARSELERLRRWV